MVQPMRAMLAARNLKSEMIRYGRYRPDDLVAALSRARAVLFLCEHETQGLAYQQAMAAGLPILAWDPGIWLDPWRFRYKDCSVVPAQTVPFFDERCGLTFKALGDFEARLDEFRTRLDAGTYNPRAYVEETLTLERCAQNYLDLLERFT
jgi:glycosyltransferase involved in cell wall biosynthesis